MTQFDYGAIDPSTMSGADLAIALGSFRDALNSHHSGATRPSYVQEGMIWVSKAASPYIVYFYDGTSDIALFTIDPSSHAKTVPDYAPLDSAPLTGTPTAPTQSAKNSSTLLATTAFVQTEKGYQRAITTLTASTTLTSDHLGNLVVCNAPAETTMTLPVAASSLQGILSLVNINTGVVTLSGSIIYDGATVTSVTLPPGVSIDLVSNGTSWVTAQQTFPVKEDADWVAGTDIVPAPVSPAQMAAAFAARTLQLGTETALTGLTLVQYTDIPSTAKRLTMLMYGASPGGDSKLAIQLGTSAGYVATGYAEGGIASASGATSAYSEVQTSILFNDTGANTGVRYGVAEFWCLGGSNKWVYRVTIMDGARYNTILGEVALPGVLDRIKFFTATGVAFDAGSVNLLQG